MLSLKVPEKEVNFRIEPRSVCALYLMLKLHFSGDYHVIKYNWQYAISQAAFNARRDKKFFERIAHKYRIHELTYLFVSALLSKTDNWIGGMTSERAITNYRKYDSLLKIYGKEFTKEIQTLVIYCKRENIKFAELFMYDRKRDSARIIRMVTCGIIKYETFIILDWLLNLIDNYDRVSECYEWMGYSTVLKAYRDLLLINFDMAIDIFERELYNGLQLEIDRNFLENNIKIMKIKLKKSIK